MGSTECNVRFSTEREKADVEVICHSQDMTDAKETQQEKRKEKRKKKIIPKSVAKERRSVSGYNYARSLENSGSKGCSPPLLGS